jgi:hypothetical protein
MASARSIRLDVDALHGEAESIAGLSDWGPDDSYLKPLRILMSAVEAMRPGRGLQTQVNDTVIQQLVTRLRLASDARENPEVLRQAIAAPVVITGLSRSGTSLMHDLLAQDPEARAPLYWEVASPWPAPDAATFDSDPRIGQYEAELRSMLASQPELRTMHLWGATRPEECNAIMEQHFTSRTPFSKWAVPAQVDWLLTNRPEGQFRTHKRVLQQLQWHGPRGRWTLKSPSHVMDLEGLCAAYPDARIVWTHREPADALASCASLITPLRRMFATESEPTAVGPAVSRMMGGAFEKGLQSRLDPAIDGRILDISYRHLVQDPVGTVARIHAHFNLPFTAAFEVRLRSYLADHPKGKHGTHRYSPEQFGLSREELNERFAGYRSRFRHLLAD